MAKPYCKHCGSASSSCFWFVDNPDNGQEPPCVSDGTAADHRALAEVCLWVAGITILLYTALVLYHHGPMPKL